jgi:hypothetical protein
MVTNEPTSDPVHTEADKKIKIKSGKIIKLLQILMLCIGSHLMYKNRGKVSKSEIQIFTTPVG